MSGLAWCLAAVAGLFFGLPIPLMGIDPAVAPWIGVTVSAEVFLWELRKRIKSPLRRLAAFLAGSVAMSFHIILVIEVGEYLFQRNVEWMVVCLSCGLVSGAITVLEMRFIRFLVRS